MTEIEQIIQLYKDQKLTKFALECELTRFISNDILDTSVEITDGESGYIATLLPEEYNGGIKMSLLIAAGAVQDYLSTSEVVDLISTISSCRVPVLSAFTKFLDNKDRAEISRSEWYALYLSLYLISLKSINESIFDHFKERKIQYTCPEGLAHLIEDLKKVSTKEEADGLIEKIKVKNLVPAKMITVIEDNFKKYQSPVTITVVDKEKTVEEIPTINALAAAIAAATNSKVGLNIQNHLPEFLSGKYDRQ